MFTLLLKVVFFYLFNFIYFIFFYRFFLLWIFCIINYCLKRILFDIIFIFYHYKWL